jgi:N6-adenosine-specific RNA methylase IME4
MPTRSTSSQATSLRHEFRWAYYSRKQVEPVLLFTKGKGVPRLSKGVRQVIIEPTREHSRKPDAQYERISELFGPASDVPCIELFARTTRCGWDSWGNETEKFEAAA